MTVKKSIPIFIGLIVFFLFSSAQNHPYKINAGNVAASVTTEGIVSLRAITYNKFQYPVKIFTSLEGCEIDGEIISERLINKGIKYTRLLKNRTMGTSCILIERFSPSKEGIHYEIEIKGTGKPWTSSIKTNISYIVGNSSRIWVPWGDPRVSKNSFPYEGILDSEKVTMQQNWVDPLLPRKFFNDTLFYGAPYFQYNKPRIAFCPFQWNLFCIPIVTILESKEDAAMSVALDPSDDILDMVMQVQSDGNISFKRLFNRISDKNILKFSMDIITHEADWRGGMRWMSRKYPQYFNPTNPKADVMAGTGAYSNSDVDFDAKKMNKMAFSTNWRASFDFPYMGMFIPPVNNKVNWTSYGGYPISIADMQKYAKKMKDLNFHILSYFNVTEFGSKIKYPLPIPMSGYGYNTWERANDFLSLKLKSAILPVPDKINADSLNFYPKTKPNGFYFTWGDAVVMDCGEPAYKEFLLDQAQKHIQLIPASDGICIDRLDWLRMYNEDRDDRISWYFDRAARSLISSWKDLMTDLGPLMHKNNKVIFVNNHTKRVDLLKNVDGIFDEFTYSGAPLNLTGLLCINKTALGWTSDSSSIKLEGPDNFFQKYLYMGVYPMAPFPGNDHSIHPGIWTDEQYLNYGPLLSAMEGKKWVLEPHCIEVKDDIAKANLFKTQNGYVIPVVFGREEKVTVIVRNISGLDKLVCKAIYPGYENKTLLKSKFNAGSLQIEVPLVRGCAMVTIEVCNI